MDCEPTVDGRDGGLNAGCGGGKACDPWAIVDARGLPLALPRRFARTAFLPSCCCCCCALGPLGIGGSRRTGACVGGFTRVGVSVGGAAGGACVAVCWGAGVAPFRIDSNVPAWLGSGGFEGIGGGMNASRGVGGSCWCLGGLNPFWFRGEKLDCCEYIWF